MSWNSSKGSVNAQPRALSWIAASVGGLALFLTLASWVLVSHPIGSTVRGYFYSIDSAQKLDLYVSSGNQSTTFPHEDNVDENVSSESKKSSDGLFSERVDQNMLSESNSQVSTSSKGSGVDPSTDENVKVTDDVSFHESNSQVPINSGTPSSASEAKEIKDQVALTVNATSSVTDDKDKVVDNKKIKESSYDSNQDGVKGISLLSNVTDNDHIGNSISMEFVSNSSSLDMGSNDTTPAFSDSNSGAAQAIHDSHVPSNASRTGSTDCDLYHGNWIYDSSGPLYTNNTCPVLTQMQNCQGNGRPDKEYENWRWKPFQCDIPRFDGRKFLELMRGKTIAFIGDSVARNQMESLLCILWQVEVPKNRGNRKMQRFFFKSTSTMVVRIWSSWLVKQRSESIDFAPEGVVKLHLDAPDDTFMEFVPNFDVIVLSSGHWFAKQSVYVLNNKIVGGQLWWPDKSRPMKVNNIEAFGISVETILTALGTHPNFSGIAIVRSYSPDHYEGGAWNTGGSCTGKTKPLAAGELVENGFTNIMHEKQVTGFNRATKKLTNKSKIRLMDITEAFQYRHDGHPGPYRNKDPNKLTKRGPDGKPPPQDCLHWCMPGPVDTWNELVLEIIRREYEGDSGFSS